MIEYKQKMIGEIDLKINKLYRDRERLMSGEHKLAIVYESYDGSFECDSSATRHYNDVLSMLEETFVKKIDERIGFLQEEKKRLIEDISIKIK